ncbi:MAG TPA: alpha/beta hydrolase [Anaerolineales bacterium]|nr:alpha/beta hydrolase [Anaerolineales bacterium]
MLKNSFIPTSANYVQQGTGSPVVLVHGLAASLHDWDDLIPELAVHGHACYALDLLGHGDSPKPDARAYEMDWIFEHFFHWVDSLHLSEPAILIGHSLGGRVALEYARRFSPATRGLILVNPFYSASQLPLLLRKTYRHTNLSKLAVHQVPERLFRFFVDVSSMAMGHSVGARHSLSERIRLQTALDYKRTAPGVYHIPSVIADMTPHLHEIDVPALVVWGDRDQTLAPASFSRVVEALPKARGEIFHAGHVPHQSHAAAFNQVVMKFLKEIKYS